MGCATKPLIPVAFAGAALFLSLLGNVVCQFVLFGVAAEQSDATAEIFFGIWYHQGQANVTQPGGAVQTIEVCKSYPSGTAFDAKWKSAKAFSIIAPVIGGVFWCWTCFALCFVMFGALWRKIGALFVLSAVFEGLTLLFLTSDGCLNNDLVDYIEANAPIATDDTCSMAWGAKCAIAATACWFVAGASMFVIDAPTRPERPPPETQTVTYTKTTQPDGTEVITTDVVKGKAVPAETPPPNEAALAAAEDDVEEFR